MPWMSAQTQTNQVPAAYRDAVKRQCWVLGQTSPRPWRAGPRIGCEAIYPFCPGTINEVQFKRMSPCDNLRSSSAAWQARQRFMTLLQSLLLKRCGAGSFSPQEGRRQVTRCCERKQPAGLASRLHTCYPARTFPCQTLETCSGFQGTWVLMSPPEQMAARGCM